MIVAYKVMSYTPRKLTALESQLPKKRNIVAVENIANIDTKKKCFLLACNIVKASMIKIIVL